MNQIYFNQVCEQVINSNHNIKGIGTLSERTLHVVLKYYYEINESYHEVKKYGYVADIVKDNEIIEIQTRAFDKLRKKLNKFLEEDKVTIVYPIAYEKWIKWVNEETGEISKPRKSPKRGTGYEVFRELYKIKQYLLSSNLNIHIMLLNMEEHRLLNGWNETKKKGSHRLERIPTKLIDIIEINELKDYKYFIPNTLPNQFTSKDFYKHAKITIKNARVVLNILKYVHCVEQVGKKGNTIVYQRVE